MSSDTFEHVWDLDATLRDIRRLLKPGGTVWASFGPPWRHPRGGHIFSVFPWAHLLLSEAALTRWRSDSGHVPIAKIEQEGLNRMTVGRFIETVKRSPFTFDYFELVPIQKIRRVGLQRFRPTREFITSVVKCRLVDRPG